MDLDTSSHLILIKIYEVDGIISTSQVRRGGVVELRNLPGAQSSQVEEPGLNWALPHSKADRGAGGTCVQMAVATITGNPPPHSTTSLPSTVTRFYYRERQQQK